MHQTHAETSQDKAGSSLCGKKDGFRLPDFPDKIPGSLFADILNQTPVLLQDSVYGFPDGERLVFCTAFRCRMLFQNDL